MVVNTLGKRSEKVTREKLLFSLQRLFWFFSLAIVSYYASFSSRSLSNFIYSVIVVIYFLFNFYIWGDLLEKAIKVHYRVHSSLDRLIARTSVGYFFLWGASFLLSSLFSLDPVLFMRSIWLINLIYFIYPTRSRLFSFGVRSHFSEFKFLDKVEKTTLVLVIILFVFWGFLFFF